MEPMDKQLKTALIVCVAAIAVAWIMRPPRYSIHSGSGTLLLDSSAGNVWRYNAHSSPPAFVRVNKRDNSVDAGALFDSIQVDQPVRK